MAPAMQDLLSILDLERLEHNLFRGRSQVTSWKRVFGGQVIGQALVAAQRTVPTDRPVHSLHGYFMLAGDSNEPIVYDVERLRDGGSFTTRRVTAIQRGQAIFSLEASFQVVEPGLEHQTALPEGIPGPEMLPSQAEMAARADLPAAVRAFFARERPVELRFVPGLDAAGRRNVWFRTTGAVPADRTIQAAVLAFVSDMTLIDIAAQRHGRSVYDPDLQVASLDHAMWFHRADGLDDWILYAQDSPSASGARGFARGSLYTRGGTLIASVAQEGLMRIRH